MIHRVPQQYGLKHGENAEIYYRQLFKPQHTRRAPRDIPGAAAGCDCGSGAHGERRPWELPGR